MLLQMALFILFTAESIVHVYHIFCIHPLLMDI